MQIEKIKDDIQVHLENFSLRDTLDCGQCFRFAEGANGEFTGIAANMPLTVRQDGNTIAFVNTSIHTFERVWRPYFDFDTDYEAIKKSFWKDPVIRKACGYAGGMRILRQDPWEALCSFIISQNNNIPRIKGIVERLCAQFGEKVDKEVYGFPSAKILAGKSEEDLRDLRAGFRAKYILDAARKVTSKEVDLKKVCNLSLEEAREELMKIKGVGIKVAECALLFGFHRLDAFPVDVWIRKALHFFYKQGFPEFAKPYGGVAQQYIFHYIRHCPEAMA